MKMHAERKLQLQAFLKEANWADAEISLLAGDASFRTYYRVKQAGKTAVLMDAPPTFERLEPFINVTNYLRAQHIAAPELYAIDTFHGFLLLEDFGDIRLNQWLDKHPDTAIRSYEAALTILSKLHTCPLPEHIAPYTAEVLLREMRLFSEWYLPMVLGSVSEKMITQFEVVIAELIPYCLSKHAVLTLRDYHADNLMVLSDDTQPSLGLLDYQDALIGHPAYDVVSLLQDARRDVPPAMAQTLLQYFMQQSHIPDQTAFHTAFHALGIQRNLKIIGIFSRLSSRDSKHHYLPLIPRVWNYISVSFEEQPFAHLKQQFEQIIPLAERKQVPKVVV
jgi:N-acetylmuramate 1-kinase